MVDKAVDSTALNSNLSDIADAIREKTGKAGSINFSDFADEIESIQEAGKYVDALTDMISRSPQSAESAFFFTDDCTKIGAHAFRGYDGSGYDCEIPDAITEIGLNAFDSAKMRRFRLMPSEQPLLYNYILYGAMITEYVEIGTQVIQQYMCQFATVPTIIFHDTREINNQAFANCSATLYDFRSATSVPNLKYQYAFNGIANGAKIVVPDSLYNDWIAATNWSASSIVGHIVKASDYTD